MQDKGFSFLFSYIPVVLTEKRKGRVVIRYNERNSSLSKYIRNVIFSFLVIITLKEVLLQLKIATISIPLLFDLFLIEDYMQAFKTIFVKEIN